MENYRDLIEIRECARCKDTGTTKTLQVHHIDGNHFNDTKGNHLVLCYKCHKDLHNYRWKLSDIGLKKDVVLPVPGRATEVKLDYTDSELDEYFKNCIIVDGRIHSGMNAAKEREIFKALNARLR